MKFTGTQWSVAGNGGRRPVPHRERYHHGDSGEEVPGVQPAAAAAWVGQLTGQPYSNSQGLLIPDMGGSDCLVPLHQKCCTQIVLGVGTSRRKDHL